MHLAVEASLPGHGLFINLQDQFGAASHMGLVIMCTMWQLTKKLFLGSLREAEVERLNEQSWREVMEILFAITIFRQDFSVSFLAMVTALLLIKALHWLAQKRVEYIETTPSVPMLSHQFDKDTKGFGFPLLSFEYMILATTTVSTFVKYVFYVSDMLMEGQWERKPVYTFYLELIRDLLHLSMYLCFFLVIFMYYGVPLHLIRELYETFRNFKIRVADYVRYRKLTSNMNDRFPDATPEELNASDATCIICREEMTTAKKLLCGHLFHVPCLRSWLERQHTCPTCRALVVPPENGAGTAGGHRGSRSDAHQQGTGTTAQGGGVPGDNLSQHEARLRAAAAAASIYEKSHVYPSANRLVWSPGYVALPQVQRQMADSANTESSGVSHPQLATPGGNLSSPQFPHYMFVPFEVPDVAYEERLGGDPNITASQLEAQKKFLQHQIEILQNQLQTLQKPKPKESMDTGPSASLDGKGKNVESSSSSVSDCGRHVELEEIDS
ncbi:unnamed protein product [Prunus armeniaca]|uniref:RING-type E3 ubiquitin transferase n=1 Tax=Prunus armeniaca TaxID=36596 RepID=A0A6J5WUW0_PRUAR|nr:unnamed protein product [Prunus armeniaca]